jgi:hypothetical protein
MIGHAKLYKRHACKHGEIIANIEVSISKNHIVIKMISIFDILKYTADE